MQRPIFRLAKLSMAGLLLLGALGHSSAADGDATSAGATHRPFVVFDATLYKNKPSFTGYPIRPITLLYEARLFPGKHAPSAMPPEQTVRSIAKELSQASEPVIIDIERWPLKGNPQVVKENVDKLVTILSWIKAEAPNIQVGAYGTVPLNDYWRAIRGPASKEHQAWQRDNDRLEKWAAQMDALYPSLYTFYPDRQGWVQYAVAQLTEAKRIAKGKPVYAFLWPQYHESNASLRLQPVEPDYWELQLNTVYQYADGLVIWGGWGDNGAESWNEEAPWWQVTKRFMRQISSKPPERPTDLTAR
jgi:Hyaluronidase